MSIGDFAARSRLSPKALRIYDELGLLRPLRVDPATGYRWYAPAQLDPAQVVALLRELDMPLARIREVLVLEPAGATMGAMLGRMRASAAGRSGLDGCPFLILHGQVSADRDGPIEIVRPVADAAAATTAAAALPDVQARRETAHDETYVALTLPQAQWPACLLAVPLAP